MKTVNFIVKVAFITILLSMLSFPAGAHCDTMDGPVIKAAKDALEKGNVNLILQWVQKDDEAEIKALFNKTMKLRKISAEVQQLADMNFFENFVRIHRAGEGAHYTGLKPAGEVEAPIAAADKALESGSLDEINKMLKDVIGKGVNEKFKEMMALKNYDKNKPEEGREFVEKYVVFIHYVEGIYKAAEISSGCPHHQKAEGGDAHTAGGCKHEQKMNEQQEQHGEKPGQSCGDNSQNCNHATHIILILTILNFIGLIIVLAKVFKNKK
ncbi:MAG: hypothetical protein HY958_01480 [Bacteroidia bacterium]|nr:hypothetical protein [Bacteroidia bacterium]